MANGYVWNLSSNRTIDWSISNGFSGEYWYAPDSVVLYVSTILKVYTYYCNVNFNCLGNFSNPSAAAFIGSDINISLDGANRFFSSSSTWA
jgi:hypothetical protein